MVKRNVTKKRQKRTVVNGLAFISSTFNNTIVTITDLQGNTLAWSSSGAVGFKGSRKSTPYAAQLVASKVVEKIQDYGVQSLDVSMKGTGVGRETVLRTLQSSGIRVGSISDVTPVPHNGCRPPKARRV